MMVVDDITGDETIYIYNIMMMINDDYRLSMTINYRLLQMIIDD